jgi:FkbM family methyltransferase
MKLNFKEILWCFFFKIKLIRSLYFYKRPRTAAKLKLLDNLDLDKNSIVIDLGANIGIVSNYLYDKYYCNIHSFEPNPYCFEVLKNIFKKNYKVKIYNEAISNNSGYQKLYLSKRIESIKNISMSETSSLEKKKTNISVNNFVEVRCISIDELLDRFDYVNFLKIDIEGHEYAIMPTLIKNFDKINKIYCEMHGNIHRPEFREDFNYWNQKLKYLANNKITNW